MAGRSPLAQPAPGMEQPKAPVRRGACEALSSGPPRHRLTVQALKHPFAHCITTLPLNSATPVQHFLSRKHSSGFPLSRGNPRSSAAERVSETTWPTLLSRLLLLRVGLRELLPQGKISLFHYGANKLNSLFLYLAMKGGDWEGGVCVGRRQCSEAGCPGRSWMVSAKLARRWLWQKLFLDPQEESFELRPGLPRPGLLLTADGEVSGESDIARGGSDTWSC